MKKFIIALAALNAASACHGMIKPDPLSPAECKVYARKLYAEWDVRALSEEQRKPIINFLTTCNQMPSNQMPPGEQEEWLNLAINLGVLCPKHVSFSKNIHFDTHITEMTNKAIENHSGISSKSPDFNNTRRRYNESALRKENSKLLSQAALKMINDN